MAAASALLAFQRGDNTNEGLLGGILRVDEMADLKLIRMALCGKVNGE